MRILTPPAVEPVSVAELKSHLRIDHDADDADLAAFLLAARADAEKTTNRTIVLTELEHALDAFPDFDLLLPRGPVVEVLAIEYCDTAGAWQTLDVADYVVASHGLVTRVIPTSGTSWPSTLETIEAVKITYTAGLAEWDDGDEEWDIFPGKDANELYLFRAAIKLIAAHWYEHREEATEGSVREIPRGATRILEQLMPGDDFDNFGW